MLDHGAAGCLGVSDAVVRDFRDRDDLLQSVSVAVLESFSSYDPARSFTSWRWDRSQPGWNLLSRAEKRNRLILIRSR